MDRIRSAMVPPSVAAFGYALRVLLVEMMPIHILFQVRQDSRQGSTEFADAEFELPFVATVGTFQENYSCPVFRFILLADFFPIQRHFCCMDNLVASFSNRKPFIPNMESP